MKTNDETHIPEKYSCDILIIVWSGLTALAMIVSSCLQSRIKTCTLELVLQTLHQNVVRNPFWNFLHTFTGYLWYIIMSSAKMCVKGSIVLTTECQWNAL